MSSRGIYGSRRPVKTQGSHSPKASRCSDPSDCNHSSHSALSLVVSCLGAFVLNGCFCGTCFNQNPDRRYPTALCSVRWTTSVRYQLEGFRIHLPSSVSSRCWCLVAISISSAVLWINASTAGTILYRTHVYNDIERLERSIRHSCLCRSGRGVGACRH